MIVYNTTIKVSLHIADEWVAWQKQEHIPEILATKLFDDYEMYRLMEQDEEDGITFTIQYFTTSKERYQKYISSFAGVLREKAFAKWGNQFTAFRTVMEAVK